MPLHICYQQLYYKLSIFFLRFLTFGRLDSSLTYSSSYNYDFVWDEPDSFSKLASHHPATFIMVRKIIWCFKYVILYITSLYLAIISHCFFMQCSCEMISHFTSISFDFWKLPNLWHFFFLENTFFDVTPGTQQWGTTERMERILIRIRAQSASKITKSLEVRGTRKSNVILSRGKEREGGLKTDP